MNKLTKMGILFCGTLALICAFALSQSTVHTQSPSPLPSPSPSPSQSTGFCDNSDREFGDARVLAQVPDPPGYPEGIAVSDDHKRIYVAAGVNPLSTEGQDVPAPNNEDQSMIFEYDRCTGALLRSFPIQGQLPVNPRAVSHLAFDNKNRLYVPEFQRGILRLNLETGLQELYATKFPDLKPCGVPAPVPATPCSPTSTDKRPVMNEMFFDKDGYLYITDSFQATIFRIPPFGPLPRTPQIWFQSRLLDAQDAFGANGIRINRKDQKIYFSITSDSAFAKAGIYTLPRVDFPTEANLKVFHLYANALGELPDGIAFGNTGLLYVAFAEPGPPTGSGGGISILREDGTEKARIKNPLIFDAPACIAFNGKGSLVVTNHSFFNGNSEKFQVIDVFVDDHEQNLYMPNVDRSGNPVNNNGTNDN